MAVLAGRFRITREFDALDGWSAARAYEAVRQPLLALGIIVDYRPDLEGGAGLVDCDDLRFAGMAAEFVDVVLWGRDSPHWPLRPFVVA